MERSRRRLHKKKTRIDQQNEIVGGTVSRQQSQRKSQGIKRKKKKKKRANSGPTKGRVFGKEEKTEEETKDV